MTLTIHHVNWGSHTLEMCKFTVTTEVFVISPQLLVQEQEIFPLPYLSGTVCFISCEVALSSPLHRDFDRAWPQCLHSMLCLVSLGIYFVGPHAILGVPASFHPIISILLSLLLECE